MVIDSPDESVSAEVDQGPPAGWAGVLRDGYEDEQYENDYGMKMVTGGASGL